MPIFTGRHRRPPRRPPRRPSDEFVNSVRKRQWKNVLHMCDEYPEWHMAKLPGSGDTALHVAVSDGQIEVVQQLLQRLQQLPQNSETEVHGVTLREILKVENEIGNTPLHLAAALGSVEMCKSIASIDHDHTLIRARNHDNETPFFVAVLYGNKDAFLYLRDLIPKDMQHAEAEEVAADSYCRSSDGNTILHAAISREYFELASHIIDLYGRLAYFVNEQGVTPFHVLANKRSAFKSGSDLGWFNKIIYNFMRNKPTPAADTENQVMRNQATPAADTENQVMRNQATPAADTENQARPNYYMCFEFVNLKTISKAMLIILGCVSNEPRKVKSEKEKHAWSLRTMKALIRNYPRHSFEYDRITPRDHIHTLDLVPAMMREFVQTSTTSAAGCSSKASQNNQMKDDEIEEISIRDKNWEKNTSQFWIKETLIIATKNGITEIVDSILNEFPLGIHDKNIIFRLAIESRQPHVYKLLLENRDMRNSIFRAVDNDGNTALHLAAKLGDRSWIIPGSKMQWEIKWYQFVKDSMPLSFGARYNKEGLTADEVFMNTHSGLVKDDMQWLIKTSDSCTIVTALIATVAFATSASVPGGVNGKNGEPVLRQERMFDVFSISSLFALCFSLIALITFLAILTTQHQAMDFRRKVPMLLLMGLTTLFLSIASMVVSFCGGHFFILKGVLRDASVVEYLVALLPLIIFVTVQFPLYFNVFRATITKMPERRYMGTN